MRLNLTSGNLDIATKRSHGNCKLINSHPFRRTPSSTIEEIDRLVAKMPGAAAYKTMVATNGGEGAPRNAAQCHYRRRKFLKGQKITDDEIENIILLSYELHGFYKLLQFQPEILIVLIHDQMKEQFSRLLTTTTETVPIYYDTTFSLGEIYVSVRAQLFSTRNM